MVTLACQRCEREWEYTGNQEYYASCPNCRSSVKVEDSSSEGSSKHSSTSEPSDPGTLSVEITTGDMVREMEVTEAVEELHETTTSIGAGQESLRQRVDDRGDELEEVATVLKELIETMGGEGEYETLDIDSDGETAMSGVAEVAEAVEVDG